MPIRIVAVGRFPSPSLLRNPLLACLFILGAWSTGLGRIAAAQEIPEPDVIYYGDAKDGANSVPPGHIVQASIGSEPLDEFAVQSGGHYVLRVQLTHSQSRPVGRVRINDTIRIKIINPNTRQEANIGDVDITGRGEIWRLDLNYPTSGVPDLTDTRRLPDGLGEPATPTPTMSHVTRTSTPSTTATRGTSTPTATPNLATLTPTSTPTPTEVAEGCVGDCNFDGTVTVNELILGVNLLLELPDAEPCDTVDADADGDVEVNELVTAAKNLLEDSCD